LDTNPVCERISSLKKDIISPSNHDIEEDAAQQMSSDKKVINHCENVKKPFMHSAVLSLDGIVSLTATGEDSTVDAVEVSESESNTYCVMDDGNRDVIENLSKISRKDLKIDVSHSTDDLTQAKGLQPFEMVTLQIVSTPPTPSDDIVPIRKRMERDLSAKRLTSSSNQSSQPAFQIIIPSPQKSPLKVVRTVSKDKTQVKTSKDISRPNLSERSFGDITNITPAKLSSKIPAPMKLGTSNRKVFIPTKISIAKDATSMKKIVSKDSVPVKIIPKLSVSQALHPNVPRAGKSKKVSTNIFKAGHKLQADPRQASRLE